MHERDEVLLAMPAQPELLRLARVTAAGLASRLGFTYDEVEDLRLAIDELCHGLVEPYGADAKAGTLQLRYILGGDRLEVEGEVHFPPGTVTPTWRAAPSELSELILSALVDEHLLSIGPDGPCFRLVKRRQGWAGGT